jgi:2,4-dichlorophenol 6-monooxygenase
VAIHDLLDPQTHLLLAGDEGAKWIAAAREIGPQRGLDIAAYRVGPSCQLQETDGSWSALRGHDSSGAILVRPDGHVAYRAVSAPGSIRLALTQALDVVTGRRAVPDSAAAVGSP